MSTSTIAPSPTNSGLKHFAIGKMWLTSLNGNKPGTIRISSSLPKDIRLTPNSTLFLSFNTKRAGKSDADYNVSVLLPTEAVDKLIQEEKAIIQRRKDKEQEALDNLPVAGELTYEKDKSLF